MYKKHIFPLPSGQWNWKYSSGHKRWWKTDVLKQSTAHRTCGDVVANQFPDQFWSRKLFFNRIGVLVSLLQSVSSRTQISDLITSDFDLCLQFLVYFFLVM